MDRLIIHLWVDFEKKKKRSFISTKWTELNSLHEDLPYLWQHSGSNPGLGNSYSGVAGTAACLLWSGSNLLSEISCQPTRQSLMVFDTAALQL